MIAAQARAAHLRVPVASTLDICNVVDGLEPSAAGELSLERGGQRVGAVYVENGRICWAAARGLARRLTELLVARAGTDVFSMESHFRACKDNGIPLGEHLVGRGIVTAVDLRSALLQHTAESLAHLCQASTGARGQWHPHNRSRYSARFSFTSAEIYARVSALADSHACTLDEMYNELGRCFRGERGEWGAVFVRTESSACPEPIALSGAWPRSATVLRRVGKWAASALDVASPSKGGHPLLAITLPPALRDGAGHEGRGDVLVAFRHGDALIVGETESHGPARILNRRAQLRRERG